MKPTQKDMFYKARRQIAEVNNLFLEFVKDGSMTRQRLEKLIERRPELWGRFVIWLDRLPEEEL